MTEIRVTSRGLSDGDDYWGTEHIHELIDSPPIADGLSSLHRAGEGLTCPIPEDRRAKLLELVGKTDLEASWWAELASIRGEYDGRQRAWKRVEKSIIQPSKRAPKLVGEFKSLMDAADVFASRLEALSPEAVDLLAQIANPYEENLFVIAFETRHEPLTLGLSALLSAARDAARLVEFRARVASAVGKDDLPLKIDIRRQVLRKPEALERLSVVWFQQGRGGKGSEAFYEFADRVMDDIDPDFSSEYEWHRDPEGDGWLLRRFGPFRRLPDEKV